MDRQSAQPTTAAGTFDRHLANAEQQLLATVSGFFSTDNAKQCTGALTALIETWIRTEYRQQVSRPGIKEEDVAELNYQLGYALDVVNLIAALANDHGEIVYLRTKAEQHQ